MDSVFLRVAVWGAQRVRGSGQNSRPRRAAQNLIEEKIGDNLINFAPDLGYNFRHRKIRPHQLPGNGKRMKIITAILPIFFLSSPSWAQDNTICKYAAKHEPAGANYIPGIDIHGKTVAPADLGAGLQTNDPISIPVTLNLAQRYDLTLPPGVELKPDVAQIEIHQDGRITYNGQDITDKVQTQCAAQTGHGQAPHDSVASSPKQTKDGSDIIKGSYPDDPPSYNN